MVNHKVVTHCRYLHVSHSLKLREKKNNRIELITCRKSYISMTVDIKAINQHLYYYTMTCSLSDGNHSHQKYASTEG
jgi:hypothetical protein